MCVHIHITPEVICKERFTGASKHRRQPMGSSFNGTHCKCELAICEVLRLEVCEHFTLPSHCSFQVGLT